MCTMKGRFDMMTIANAVGVADDVAITSGYVAHYDLGLARRAVRSRVAGIPVVAILAVVFFGKKLRKAK